MRLVLCCVVALVACGSDPEPSAAPIGPPSELADEDALTELSSLAALPELHPERLYRQQSSFDRGKGGGGLPLFDRGNKDLNNFVCASADAELGKGLAPMAFDEPSCTEPYVRGAVAARFVGSGRMVRFWMTALSMRLLPADDEVVRIWVDDEPVPVVDAKVSAMADGSAGEMFAPPFGAGSFRYVSWRYPVVFARKLVVAVDGLGVLDNVYHQTDVVLDASPKARHRAQNRLLARDRAKAALAVSVATGETLLDERRTLARGEPTTFSIAGPATLNALSVAHPERLGDVELSVSWDGVEAMKLPLSDLFAATLAAPSRSSLGIDVADGTASLRLPMPFGKNATFRVTNSGEPIEVVLSAKGTRGPAAATRLFAIRSDTVAPATGDHPLVHVSGPGRWVGTCAMLEGHALAGTGIAVEGLNFLEGDEKVSLDGALALPGTGTEDYFDSAFYFLGGDAATPFAAWWGVTDDRSKTPARGRASACRFHVLNDAIDFTNRLDADLEIGPGDASLLDRYRTVAFVYR